MIIYLNFSLYNDYMGNSEKTTGLFTENKDFFKSERKERVKRYI